MIFSIFQDYEQVEGQDSSSGTGLGLSITKNLVEAHEGLIEVESVVDQGSAFRVSLARYKADNESITEASDSQHEELSLIEVSSEEEKSDQEDHDSLQSKKTNVLRGAKILCVDDEPVNLVVLKNHFSLEECEFFTESDPKKAVDMILNGSFVPHLILLDVMMPRLNGYDVTRKIREFYSQAELPIILLTAKDQDKDVLDGLRSGANDFMTKPVHWKKLKLKMQSLVDLSKLTNHLDSMVYERTNDIISILSNIGEGLCTINEDGCIEPRYSPFLKDMLQESELAGKTLYSLLSKISNLPENQLSRFESAVLTTVGSLPFQFRANSTCFPTQFVIFPKQEELRKEIEAYFDPVVEDGEVVKILVSLRDVSSKNQALRKAEKTQVELEILGEIIGIGHDLFHEKLEYNLQLFVEAMSLCDEQISTDKKRFEKAKRNLHTIKGNASISGIRRVANDIHKLEDQLIALSNSVKPVGENFAAFRLLANRARKTFDDYKEVADRYFEEQKSHEWISNEILHDFEDLQMDSSDEAKIAFAKKLAAAHSNQRNLIKR